MSKTKTDSLYIRVTPEYKQIIKEKADSLGLSLSDFVRMVLRRVTSLDDLTLDDLIDILAAQEAIMEYQEGNTIPLMKWDEAKKILQKLRDDTTPSSDAETH